MHLADAFIQSDLQYIQAIHAFISMIKKDRFLKIECSRDKIIFHEYVT